ncbi:MAG: hypothetical protein IRY99_22745, partial [Isosphaeraceae bacterium]|nr:hypothetical protein [Isosphaeraceae bacterium]
MGSARAAEAIRADLSGYRPEGGINVHQEGDRLTIGWPLEEGEQGRLVLDLSGAGPLIASLGIAPEAGGAAAPVLEQVEPATFLTVGTRVAPPGRPPQMSAFNVFFDAPAQRPHETYKARLDLRRAKVTSQGRRATVALGELSAGPFAGELHLTVYAGARLVHVEAVVSTREDLRAFLYDAGLVAAKPSWRRMAWIDTEGRLWCAELTPEAADQPLAVRHRVIVAEGDAGALACFPPPHQFFFPRDRTDNLKSVWFGRGHRGWDDRIGFGVRQAETGGGSFVPWFNAPPGTEQHLGVFYLLSRGKAEDALRETLRYTHGDRFPDLPGHVTFTSHWHMAIAVAALQEQARGTGRTVPDFVRMFKDMNVDLVHLAEFHGDGHPQDPGPLRLPELEAMFAECRRLSDEDLLLLPGEEANVYLGLKEPGKHPGHWLYLFPRPVFWIMRRSPGEPFAEEHPKYGTLYRVGSREDMIRLLEREHGLAWTAHPRIKASSWTPDIYKNEDFYKADFWLGAAWKAMPADLSRPRLGERALDLLDDMANWGDRKYLLGEVDVFKLDHTHELYGHMNINYLRLDRRPRFDEGWQPVLDALRGGRFFVTTGEVLVREFTVGGRASGAELELPADGRPEMRAELEWTFPLRFAELISGDGRQV